ncbi:MAG: hypothetical protein HY394_02875 [Candidatus Diapherotrites archaeon]|nr:hypothetical protein [Candidatus Diapherotrites archaeon]
MVEQKINLFCPKCGEKVEVLWVYNPPHAYFVPGSRAGSEKRIKLSSNIVQGNCSCGYVFKVKDLDDY